MAKAKAEELKELGNVAIQKGNVLEAMIHYTHAIKYDPQNHLLYSNRSLAFLKSQQYYFAMDDACKTIKLKPSWPKGFYRKGEVEYEVGRYTDALKSYQKAMDLDPNDSKVKDAIDKANREIEKEKKIETRQPLMFAGAGILIGSLIVLADVFVAKQPSLSNSILQILIILVFGALGFGISKLYRFMLKSQKNSLLDRPLDLLDETENVAAETDTEPSMKNAAGGKAAAYQRHRKGKS